MTDEHPERAADEAAAARQAAIMADNDRLLERVASISMASGSGPWPVADDVGKVTWVGDEGSRLLPDSQREGPSSVCDQPAASQPS